MTTIIVLAMHGMPPSDVPKPETAELFGLHARLERASETVRAALESRYAMLDNKMRRWPRNTFNDPFYAGSLELAQHLSQATDCEVVTPTMTRGDEHSEVEIPDAIRRAQAQYPSVTFQYVWPFPAHAVAQYLAAQIAQKVSVVDHILTTGDGHGS
jgi:hypothetical protein